MTVFALFGKCFFCSLFWGIFLGDGIKGFGVLWSVDVNCFEWGWQVGSCSVV